MPWGLYRRDVAAAGLCIVGVGGCGSHDTDDTIRVSRSGEGRDRVIALRDEDNG